MEPVVSSSELELMREGEVVRVIAVAARPVRVGRHIDNDVILPDEDISGHHLVLSAAAGGLVVRDLRSTNGTWVNGTRVVGEAPLMVGDKLRVGLHTTLRVRQTADASFAVLAVRDLVANTLHIAHADRMTFGAAPSSTIQLPSGPQRAATLMFQDGGASEEDEIWLDSPEEARVITRGEVFSVGDRRFVVESAPGVTGPTWQDRLAVQYPYELEVTMDGPGGAVATLIGAGARHTISAETRSILLYVLAARRLGDLEGGMSSAAAGWIADEELIVAVWGKGGLRQTSSNYSVLLHRLRREIEEFGFDPGFLEKRRGASRLRLDTIRLR